MTNNSKQLKNTRAYKEAGDKFVPKLSHKDVYLDFISTYVSKGYTNLYELRDLFIEKFGTGKDEFYKQWKRYVNDVEELAKKSNKYNINIVLNQFETVLKNAIEKGDNKNALLALEHIARLNGLYAEDNKQKASVEFIIDFAGEDLKKQIDKKKNKQDIIDITELNNSLSTNNEE